MIILDIETSGLDPEKNGLISVGAVDLKRPNDTFYGEARLNPDEEYVVASKAFHGLSEDEARSPSRQSRRQLLQSFNQWYKTRDIKVIGGLHVYAFDIPFINAKSRQSRAGIRLHLRSIDLYSVAYARLLNSGQIVPLTDGWSIMDASYIYPLVGLPPEPLPGTALDGAKWQAEAMHRLIYARGLLAQFKQYPLK